MPTYLEPSIDRLSADSTTTQSVGAYNTLQPETSFESTLANAAGTSSALAFLGADGLAFATAQNPSFGGQVVSTAISNLGAGSAYTSGYGFGSPQIYNSGFGGSGGGFGGNGQSLPNTLSTNPAFNGSGGFNGGASGSGTVDGFGPQNVKQSIIDEGLQQIMLMVQVQQAARTLDAMSNILKTQHDANMNTVRNIRS